MKQVITLFLIWLLLTAVGIGIGVITSNPFQLNHFIENGIPVYAKVTAKEPDNHQDLRFVYEVNGKQYSGTGGAGLGNPEFDQIPVGGKIVVFYDPERPENYFTGYPQLFSRTNNFAIVFCAILVPLTVMCTLYRKGWLLKLF